MTYGVFGEQTIGFVAITDGEPDINGITEQVRTQTNISGCRFRPLKASEKVGLVENIASETWQGTCPPNAAVLSATAISEIVYDGTDDPQRGDDDENVFLLVGAVQPFTDFTSTVHKVTVLAQRQHA